MQSVFGSACPDGLAGRIAFRFPGGEAGLVFGNGQVTAVRGPIENAQATIDTTPEAMMALAAEVLPLDIAAQRGLMKVEGSPETLMAFAKLWEHALDNIPALRRRKQRLAAAKAAG